MLNRLNVKTKGELLYANAIIRSKKFRKSRSETKEGRRLYNQELRLIKRKAKQFNVNISKLPSKMEV